MMLYRTNDTKGGDPITHSHNNVDHPLWQKDFTDLSQASGWKALEQLMRPQMPPKGRAGLL